MLRAAAFFGLLWAGQAARPNELQDEELTVGEGPLPGRQLYIGVFSAPTNAPRRQRVRAAFLDALRREHTDGSVRAEFIIGHGHFQGSAQGTHAAGAQLQLEEALRAESEQHGDIRRIPLPEAYENLPDKTLQLLSLGVAGRYKFVVKVDDDMVLDVQRALSFFQKQDPSSLLYVGSYLWDKPAYKPAQLGVHGEFAKYYGGPVYAVSWELARRVTGGHATHSGEFLLYGSSSEDVDMGYWANWEAEQPLTLRGKHDDALKYLTVKLASELPRAPAGSYVQQLSAAKSLLELQHPRLTALAQIRRHRARGNGSARGLARAQGCLAAREPRPSVVSADGVTIRVANLGDLRSVLQGATTNDGLLKPGGPAPQTACVREVPKLVHFIWLGGPLNEEHARNIIGVAQKNPQWSVLLWVDHEVPGARAAGLAAATAERPAGAVAVKWVPQEKQAFRNRDLIDREGNLAGKADYMRMEVVYRHGGIYLDTDAHAVHGFDDFGRLFRWPFVAQDSGAYKNLGNCVFGFEQRSAFLDFALDAARENCLTYNTCGVLAGAGPGFLTGAYLRYNQPEILLIDQVHLVQSPRPQNVVMYHDMEASWMK